MKRIKRFLFNFNSVYFYTYFAGILVSLAINFSFKTEGLTISVDKFKNIIMASSFFVSSFGAFRISALLEAARREWELAGCPKDEVVIRQDYIEKGQRKELLRFYFAVVFFGPALLIIYFIQLFK